MCIRDRVPCFWPPVWVVQCTYRQQVHSHPLLVAPDPPSLTRQCYCAQSQPRLWKNLHLKHSEWSRKHARSALHNAQCIRQAWGQHKLVSRSNWIMELYVTAIEARMRIKLHYISCLLLYNVHGNKVISYNHILYITARRYHNASLESTMAKSIWSQNHYIMEY